MVVTTGTTAPYTPSNSNDAITNPTATNAWLDAGAGFCGGSIAGIKTKLGYLKRMGVTAVWIGPLFKNVAKLQTYHGYGVQDFLDIDPRFGTKEELKDLVSQAHSMGMYVLLDIIMNHSGNVWTYQNGDPNFSNSQKYPVQGYYDADRNVVIPFTTVDQTKFPDAFPDGSIWPQELQDSSCFHCEGQIQNWDANPEFLEGDFYDLKDFNLGQDDVNSFTPTQAVTALTEAYKYWIAYTDIDGYRLDTVKHMGQGPTRFFTQSIHEFAEKLGKNNFMIVGEIAGGDVYQTVQVTGLDAALGIGNIMQLLWNIPRGLAEPSDFFNQFRNEYYDYPGAELWLKNRVFTMIDDHDQIWKGDNKARFCAAEPGPQLILAALALNLCTLGIPCVYYGSEQSFDGSGGSGSPGHGSDQYIREAMFGGAYGPFRSSGAHCFNEQTDVYKQISIITSIRSQEVVLRRGRQFLREISGDGSGWGVPYIVGDRMLSVVAWSRILDGVEIICAINTDNSTSRTALVTVDNGIQSPGDSLTALYPLNGAPVQVQSIGGRLAISLTVPAGGFVLFK
jgi:glycosidase